MDAKKKSWGQMMEELLKIKTKEKAKVWFAKEIENHSEAFQITPEESEKILKPSLGYMMGYYDKRTAMKLKNLLDLQHPIFPTIGM